MNRETTAEGGTTSGPPDCLSFGMVSPNPVSTILCALPWQSDPPCTWILGTYNSTFQASDLSLHRINGGAVPMPDLSQVTWVGRERG